MPKFYYKMISKGEIEEGYKFAASYDELVQELNLNNCVPIKITQINESSLSIFKQPKTLNLKNTLFFSNQLTILLDAGLPLDRTLDILKNMYKPDTDYYKSVDLLTEKVLAGVPLSKAMADQSPYFNEYLINMIKAGEMSGNLVPVLKHYTNYLEQVARLKESVSTALIYPFILLTMMIASVWIMMGFVVPQFKEMFEFEKLPFATQVLFYLSGFIQENTDLLLGLLLLFFSLTFVVIKTGRGRQAIDQHILDLPLLGASIKIAETSKLSYALGTLIQNGVAVTDAIQVAKNVASNAEFKAAIGQAAREINEGKGIHQSLKKYSIFPELFLQLIKMGEETGKIDESLLKLGEIFANELQTRIKKFLSLLEPILIVIMGAMIGFIVVSLFMAILSVNDFVI